MDIVLSNIELSQKGNIKIPNNEIIDIIIRNDGPSAKRTSTKNIKINVRSFFSLFAAGAFSVAATLSNRWLIPFAIIVIFQELKKQYEIELDKLTAIVLLSFATKDLSSNSMDQGEIVRSSMCLSEEYGEYLSEKKVMIELEKLVRLGVVAEEGGKYKLVEKLNIKQG